MMTTYPSSFCLFSLLNAHQAHANQLDNLHKKFAIYGSVKNLQNHARRNLIAPSKLQFSL